MEKLLFVPLLTAVLSLVAQDLAHVGVSTAAFPFDLDTRSHDHDGEHDAEDKSVPVTVQEMVIRLEPISSTVIPVDKALVYAFDPSGGARAATRSSQVQSAAQGSSNSVNGGASRGSYRRSGPFFDMSSRPKNRVRLITKYSQFQDRDKDEDQE